MCGIYSPHNVAQEKQSLKEKKKVMHKSLCLHMGVIKEFVWYLRGAVDLKHQFYTALFLFFCCVHLYVCMLCTNFQDLCVIGDITLCILLLTFISMFCD